MIIDSHNTDCQPRRGVIILHEDISPLQGLMVICAIFYKSAIPSGLIA